MANILITGGTGSLGSFLARKWYTSHRITVLSRDPHKQTALAKELPDVTFFLTDICNYREVEKACLGQDMLIHAAALKNVDTGEYHPSEFTRVNILGTQVLADAWASVGYGFFRKALLISTDKAVASLNTYGATKKVAEAIFRKHDYSVIRYGNVVDSQGSFLHVWKDLVKKERPIKVRTPAPTRFFLTLEMAAVFIEEVLRAIDKENGIFVPRGLKSFSIMEIANSISSNVEGEPLLPYEKIDEILLAEGEVIEEVSDKLGLVHPGWSRDFPPDLFSLSAERMQPEEFLNSVGWADLLRS